MSSRLNNRKPVALVPLVAAGVLSALCSVQALAQTPAAAKAAPRSAVAPSAPAAPRQMQIHKVAELGLEIWVENQPVWETQLSSQTGHPTFVAQSPEGYHPPTVMTYASWPKEKVAPDLLIDMATTAIRRASENFGLNAGQARNLDITAAKYGSLVGYESVFKGLYDHVAMDVRVFVGQAPGKYPVALNMYTLRGKMANLDEQRRRAWGNLRYLPR
jgi:hypothetical protein